MNPVPLFLIIVTLPLLLGGCGEKPVAETKPVEKKVLEVKEKVKPEEPLAETKPKKETPLNPLKYKISEKIKKSFDPKRIFNPGKMYSGI